MNNHTARWNVPTSRRGGGTPYSKRNPHILRLLLLGTGIALSVAWVDVKTTPMLSPVSFVTPVYAQEEAPVNQFERFFGKHWRVAYALAQAESGLNPTRTKMAPASGKYPGECSIGLFQINLASNGCQGKKVHWNKVPGKTLEEKIAWLKVPENNLYIASLIYTQQGFSPWGAYTNGSYKKFLGGK